METNEEQELHLSAPERTLLAEYQKLSQNLKLLADAIRELAEIPSPQILESLQKLEEKTSLVFTLLKASVYSVFVQNEEGEEIEDEGNRPDESMNYNTTAEY